MFKAGDYVKLIGYIEYQPTIGILFEQNGLFYINAIVRENGVVKTRQYGLALNSLGQVVDDLAYGTVIVKVSKADYTRFLRQVKNGTITWGVGG